MDLHTSTSPLADPRLAAATGPTRDNDTVSQANDRHRSNGDDVSIEVSSDTSSASNVPEEESDKKAPETTAEQPDLEKAGSKRSSRHDENVHNYPNNLVDFDGPDDTENPKNFSKAKKWAVTASMGWMTFVVTFSSSIFSVAVEPVSQEFAISRVVATLGVSLFLLVSTSKTFHLVIESLPHVVSFVDLLVTDQYRDSCLDPSSSALPQKPMAGAFLSSSAMPSLGSSISPSHSPKTLRRS